MCVCVCVRENRDGEREWERERARDREREREGESGERGAAVKKSIPSCLLSTLPNAFSPERMGSISLHHLLRLEAQISASR